MQSNQNGSNFDRKVCGKTPSLIFKKWHLVQPASQNKIWTKISLPIPFVLSGFIKYVQIVKLIEKYTVATVPVHSGICSTYQGTVIACRVTLCPSLRNSGSKNQRPCAPPTTAVCARFTSERSVCASRWLVLEKTWERFSHNISCWSLSQTSSQQMYQNGRHS